MQAFKPSSEARQRRRRRRRLQVEALESRRLLAVIAIDPGAFTAEYRLNGAAPVTGPISPDLDPGTHSISLIPGVAGFTFDVDASGNVVQTSGSATGGLNSLDFNTISVNIDPGAFPGDYSIPYFDPAIGTAPRDVTLVLGVSNYSVSLRPGVAGFNFALDATGNVVQATGAAVGGPGSLTFNTIDVSIDPGAFPGDYSIPYFDPTIGTGPRNVTLVPGVSNYSVSLRPGVAGFNFALDATGNVVQATGAAVGGPGSLTFNTIDVSIDPGAFPGDYSIPYFDPAIGTAPRNVTLVPGVNNYSVSLRPGVAGFNFALDATGNVVQATGAAVGGPGSLTFNTIDVSIDPGAFPGDYSIPYFDPTIGTGPRNVTLVPGVNSYSVSIIPGIAGFNFNLDASGRVIQADGSAVGSLGLLTFNTVELTVDPGTYTGDFRVNTVETTFAAGPRTLTLVPGVNSYNVTVVPGTGFNFNVGPFGQPNASDFSVPVSGTTHTFQLSADTTFSVNDPSDVGDATPVGDGVVDVDLSTPGYQITLRSAIEESNGLPGSQLIGFNLPGGGSHTIQPISPLPNVVGPVVIDGYTQPGSTANTNPIGFGLDSTILVELNGSQAGSSDGLRLVGGGSTIRGMTINNFAQRGISVESDGNLIVGNFIGTNAAGTANQGNLAQGISVFNRTANVIGGNTPADRNLISGNGQEGISISGFGGANSNRVEGNLIGTNAAGIDAVPNRNGVSISSGTDNQIGGPGGGNLISGNTNAGVTLSGLDTTVNVIQGNSIGSSVAGDQPLGNGIGVQVGNSANGNLIGGANGGQGNFIAFNDGGTSNISDGAGVAVENSSGNLIIGNQIADNLSAGVVVRAGSLTTTGNRIQGNTFAGNGGLGIDLGGDGVSANDLGDDDTGGNSLQNFPVLTTASTDGGVTEISGSLNGSPNTTFELELFSSPVADASGHGEGVSIIGMVSVTTDALGDADFNVSLPVATTLGYVVAATATDPAGNTSEFSAIQTISPPTAGFISGRVFDDLDNDGFFEPGEPGIAGVTLELHDQSGQLVASETTDEDGGYAFTDLALGTYEIVETQPTNFLDGLESAGNLGGIVSNDRDSNVISSITIGSGDPQGSGYDFAELRPSDVLGMVWRDFNNDGQVNFGEQAIDNVEVRLTGVDDHGDPVNLTTLTDVDGIYMFIDLRPSDASGYTLTEIQPSDFIDGVDTLGTINGVVAGNDLLDDRFSGIVLAPGAIAENYNFGERPPEGGQVAPGRTATIGFWQNKNGQQLLTSVNGEGSTNLSAWLATTFSNMYGIDAGDGDLSGMTNTEVGGFYNELFRRKKKEAVQLGLGGPAKMDAQVMASAFAVYVTSSDLAGTSAESYGFTVTSDGAGLDTFNVGDNGLAFGVDDGSDLTVLDMLFAVNDRSLLGVLYDTDGDGDADDNWETSLRIMANEVFSALNEQGGHG